MGSSTSSDDGKFKTIEEVRKAVRHAGLESINLIFGIDYTKSNLYTGERSFEVKNLHSLEVKNPYMEIIEILGESLKLKLKI
jgi:E3 ubiquitin-protein ligase RGLG